MKKDNEMLKIDNEKLKIENATYKKLLKKLKNVNSRRNMWFVFLYLS